MLQAFFFSTFSFVLSLPPPLFFFYCIIGRLAFISQCYIFRASSPLVITPVRFSLTYFTRLSSSAFLASAIKWLQPGGALHLPLSLSLSLSLSPSFSLFYFTLFQDEQLFLINIPIGPWCHTKRSYRRFMLLYISHDSWYFYYVYGTNYGSDLLYLRSFKITENFIWRKILPLNFFADE